MKLKVVAAGIVAFGGFVVAGPLQHFGVLPQTAFGDASKTMIKAALDMSSKPAYGRCGPQGNNGFGNFGGDLVPGQSGSAPGCAGCAADTNR